MPVDIAAFATEECGLLAKLSLQIEGLEDLSERRREAAGTAMLELLEVRHVLRKTHVGASACLTGLSQNLQRRDSL